MNLINATKMPAQYAMGLDAQGREWLTVVVKGTFVIPADERQEPALAAEQVPLIVADIFTGEPGLSAPIYESDFALRKPRCDVLLNGSAYAPGGKPVERCTVSLKVGSLAKAFDVVGNRIWQAGAFALSISPSIPFTRLRISYDNAFGGVDRSQPDPARHRWFAPNHAGVGYHEHTDAASIDGKPLANTEERGHPTTNPRGNHRPMAFGPVGRAWQPRPKFAGTYDQKWLDDVSPFLPRDFDERYYQAAPADQQMDYPAGGEPVELVNLTPEGRTCFRLPKLDVPVEFDFPDYSSKVLTATIDTVVIEPDRRRFMLTWRTQLPLKRNVFEVTQIVAGKMSAAWYRARRSGKTYYPSLAAAIAQEGVGPVP